MVSRRNYIAIVMLFLSIFIMFMFVGKSADAINNRSVKIRSSDNLSKESYNSLTTRRPNIDGNTNLHGKRSVAIIAEKNDVNTGLIAEWCVYNKYLYKIYNLLPAKDEIEDYNLIIFGDMDFTKDDCDILYSFAQTGKTMIFTKLPDYQVIGSDKELAGFFGIEEALSQNVNADGFKIFTDFFISKERVYQKGDYFGSKDDTEINVSQYKLLPGYEVYAVALFDNYEEKGIEHLDLPPLLWRTKTNNSYVFVVGSDIFSGLPLLGVLTGFMAHESPLYLYPVVNAQTISLVDFPYFCDENRETMKRTYSRDSEDLARDILWPNIIQILKNYGGSYNFFAVSQFDYRDNNEPDNKYLKFYVNEINKLAGSFGLSLSQISEAGLDEVIDKNYLYYGKNIPDARFSSLYLGDFSEAEIKGKLDHKIFENISIVMSEYNEGDKLIDIIDNNILSVKFNQYGYRHETFDDLQMVSIENALGICNMNVNVSRILYPREKDDEWHNLSLIWSKGDTYFNDFTLFDMVSVHDLEKRVRRFLALDFAYECKNNDLYIELTNFDEEAYFILWTYDKTIGKIESGEYFTISDNAYLIKAEDSKVYIELKDEDILEKPKNNKSVSVNP